MVNVGVLSLLQKKRSWCLGWGNWSKPCLEDKAKSLILSSSSQAWRVGSAFWSWNWTRMIRWWVKMKYTEVGSRSMSLAKTPWRATSCFPNCFKTCKYAHVQKRSQKLWAALWTSTWAPTGTVFLTYVVTLFFGIKFLLKITTGIWHQSTSARSWFYSSTLDHRCAFACVLCMWSQYVWEWTHETLHIIISFQHALEPLVDRVCAVQQDKEFLYKRDSQGKLVTRHRRLADPSHGTAIKSFRKTEQLKSKLPQAFWAKSWKKNCILFVVWKLFALCSTVASFLIYISKMCNKRNKHTFKEWQILFRKCVWT